MPLTETQQRDKREQSVRNQSRKQGALSCTIRTTRPETVADGFADGTEQRDYGKFRPYQFIAVVRTGSARMRREFDRQCVRLGVKWEHVGNDDSATTGEGEGALMNPYNATDANRELNHNVESEFIVWGSGGALATLFAVAMGDKKPIVSWRRIITVRVIASSGAGSMEGTVEKRVRNVLSGKQCEFRELRQQLNSIPATHKASIYNAEHVAVLRAKAERALARFVDMNDDTLPGERIAFWFESLFNFIRIHNREPEDRDELRKWLATK